MKNFKLFCLGLLVCFLLIKADCNKVNEEVSTSDYYFIEGRLLKSCLDTTPINNFNFKLYPSVYSSLYVVDAQTDSSGYFKIKTNCPGGFVYLADVNASRILDEIPAGKYLNLGNVVLNNQITVKLIYNNYSQLTNSDSLLVNFSNTSDVTTFSILSPKSDLTVKQPFNSKEIRTIRLRLSQLFTNKNSKSLTVTLYKNNYFSSNILGKNNILFSPCDNLQEIIFE